MNRRVKNNSDHVLSKSPTGIAGLDQITFGGLPAGRPTLVCGGAGCGKTLLGIEFLVRAAAQYDEPGVCISFEETAHDLSMYIASLGFDLEKLQKQKKLALDYIYIDKSEIAETGEYDLEGLFIRLNTLVRAIPKPARKTIGDLSNTERVLVGLDVRQAH